MAVAYLEKLNTEQRRAVEHGVQDNACEPCVPLLVIAGAGSGKTNTLAHRVAHLVVNGYQANLRTYQLLRYGVSVQIAAGKPNDQVHLVDWEHPEKNDFALAEEVTLRSGYADIAQNLTEAGYSETEAAALQKEVEFYGDTRGAIKKHSGEELDIKPYEADMRHLLNTYVQADSAAEMGNSIRCR